MKPLARRLTVAFLALLPCDIFAAIHYVDVNNAQPSSPYLDWSAAATNIQDAVDAAGDGDLVLVTNGIYATGGQVVNGQDTNRAALTRAITLLSVNGPQATTIVGGTQTRGAYVSSNALLSGFTIVGGQVSGSGGGVWCERSGVVSNCIIRSNLASFGGGIYGGTVYNSTLTTNQGGAGGGAARTVLYNSILTSNTASSSGGGAFQCLLSNCTVAANYAYSSGGGVDGGTNYNCVLDGNRNNYRNSGGAADSTLYNCVLMRNSAGADNCTLYNCTVVGNSASSGAGGLNYNCTACNSIIYFNSGPVSPNWYPGSPTTLTNCCTFPLPPGAGNFIDKPGLVDVPGGNLRLQIGSRCINAGSNAFAPAGADLDGNPRIVGGSVDVGAYEDQALTTAMLHFVNLNSTNPVSPYTSWLTAATSLQDAVAVAQDGAIVVADAGIYNHGGTALDGSQTNRVVLTNAITLLGVNGASATTIAGGLWTRCAYVGSNATLIGFTLVNGRAEAFYTDPFKQQNGGGALCAPGGVLSSCIVQSNFTSFSGGAIYGGTIHHSTLTGNFAFHDGGGACSATVDHCSISNNSAIHGGGACLGAVNNSIISSNQASAGGGACSNSLNNCVLRNNLADSKGGGAYNSDLVNCTVVSNKVSGFSIQPSGGGVYGGTSTNCIIYFNAAFNGANFLNTIAVNCCTLPSPASGTGNFTNDPAFVDLSQGNLRLQSGSPCINAGNNASVTAANDLDGNPRIIGGTVDIGAYECQSPALLAYFAWMQTYALPTDAMAVYADSDNDGMNNWQEWHTGTVPNDPASLLKLLMPANGIPGTTVTWQSVSRMTYFIQRSGDLSVPASFLTVQDNIAGQPGTTSYLDTSAIGAGPFFYRVGVR